MISYKNIEINAWEHNQVQELITQGEGGIKYLYFTLYDNNGVVDLTDATEVIYSATKPDKNAVYNNLEPFDVAFDNTGKVKLKITTGMANIKGVVKGEIQVITPDGVLIFYGIDLKIEKGNGKGVESSNEFTALTKALNKIAILTPEGTVADGAITTEKIANESVTEDKLADGSITTEKIAEDLLKLILGGSGSSGGVTYEQVKTLIKSKEDTTNKVTFFDELFKDPDKFPTVMAVINYLKDYYYNYKEIDGMLANLGGGTITEEDLAKLKAELSQVELPTFVNSIEECADTSKLYVLPDGFIYAYIKTTAVIPAYTNKVLTSTNSNGNVYNSTGYKEDYRLNSSGTETEMEGAVCSGFISMTKGDVIYILSDASNASNTAHYFDTYNSSFTKISANGGANIGTWSTLNGRYLWTIDTSVLSVTPAYFRCSTCSSGADFIVSVNEPLDGKETTVETYAWTNTGHAFVPADYENRIINLEEDVTDLKNKNTTSIGVPNYVKEEAEAVADKVLSVRNAYSFVFGAISDTHTDGTESADSIIHAGMGLNTINKRTQLDVMFNFGDVAIGYFNDTYEEGFPFVKECLYEVSRSVPYIQLQGNHDQLSADTTEEAQQKYFAYIGANNVGTVTDWTNRFRNYGYRDFDDQKMRVIYLNTTDVSEVENTQDVGISSEQYSWLINTALDFSNKDDAENWGFIVCSHHPLNWYYLDNLLVLLNAYKGKTSGSITTDDTSIAYDFTNATAELIAHFHGHLHNFRVEKLGENEITTITIPNACFDRNNEYGTSSSYDETVHTNYGDSDENGNQRQFNKIENTAEDTAFNVVVVDRQNRKIHCFNYGAGIDREISY